MAIPEGGAATEAVEVLDAVLVAEDALPPLRQAYVNDVLALEDRGNSARAAGQSTEDTARMHVDMRNQLKVDYHALSPVDAVKAFEQRNVLKYGNPLGPSTDQLRVQTRADSHLREATPRPESPGERIG